MSFCRHERTRHLEHFQIKEKQNNSGSVPKPTGWLERKRYAETDYERPFDDEYKFYVFSLNFLVSPITEN